LDGLSGARASLARIDECISKLREFAPVGVQASACSPEKPKLALQPVVSAGLLTDFTAALDNDLNISAAWAAIFDWVSDTNKRIARKALSPADAVGLLGAWDQINSVLGIAAAAETEAPAEIVALLEARQAARKAKDFKRSDEIRDALKAKGWVVEDSPKGPKLKKL